MEKLSTIGFGNLGLCLPLDSLDLHHTQRQQGEILDWPYVLISLKENSSNSTGWIRVKTSKNVRPIHRPQKLDDEILSSRYPEF